MTVNTTNITSGPYAGNGVTTQFSYTFRIETKNQISVYESDDNGVQTLLTVDTDYTVSGLGDDSGGIVTRTAGALPTGYSWYIRSNYQDTQLTDFDSQGGFFPDVHEAALDKLTFLIQQINDQLGRSLRIDESDDTGSLLPLPILTAGSFLQVNPAANGFDLFTAGVGPVTAEVPLASYDDFRNGTPGFDIGDYSDGQIIWFTNEGIVGAFVLESGATPVDNGGTIIRSNVDSNRYVERIVDHGVVLLEQFGVLADNSTDDYTALTNALNSGYEIRTNLTGISVLGTAVSIPSGTRMNLTGSSKFIFRITHSGYGFNSSGVSNVWLSGFDVDLDSTSETGIQFSSSSSNLHMDDIHVYDLPTGTANFRGAIIFDTCSYVYLNRCRAWNIEQGGANEVRAFSFTNSTWCFGDQLHCNNVDKAYHISGSTNVHLSDISCKDLNDNGIYIISSTSKVTINGLDFTNPSEGIVLYSDIDNAQIEISNFSISGSSSRGISWRAGNGYRLTNGNLEDCGNLSGTVPALGDSSSFAGGEVILENVKVTNSPWRAVNFIQADSVVFRDVDIEGAGDANACRFTNVDSVEWSGGSIKNSSGSSTITNGLRVESSSAMNASFLDIAFGSNITNRYVDNSASGSTVRLRDNIWGRSFGVYCRLSAGTSNFLPEGWSLSNTGTGEYTVVHNLGFSDTRRIAVSGSLTSGSAGFLTWEVVDGDSFIVNTFNSSGTATDSAFSVNVTTTQLA